ncbi:hypothetical protein [Luteolibacter sp. LG18]|uniref:hypothetical protein n=1 Tax=Luteolibacter sp. LG18 TaxID=2819286 RepID=UPI002B2CABDE|nr:hypothetical protein llg_08760 [Luteolibacter sp. LG18]
MEVEDSGAEVPVLIAEDISAPRVVLPTRRSTANEIPVRAEAGLRIDSRFSPGPQSRETAGAGEGILVSELGKGVVRLDSEVALPTATRTESLPVMQPRARRAKLEGRDGEVWGRGHHRHSHRWLWWCASVVLVAMAGGFAIQPLLAKRNEAGRVANYDLVQMVDEPVQTEDPMAYFTEHSAEAEQEMRSVLTAYARARRWQDVEPLVRDGSRFTEALEKYWRAWAVPADWQPAADLMQSYGASGNRGFGTMSGLLPDFAPYSVCFVREGGKMLVDWKATVGFGTPAFPELSSAVSKEADVRVLIAPSTFYTAAFPESRFQAYGITREGADNIVWGYAGRDSEAGRKLAGMFQSGTILGSNNAAQPVRVKLGRSGDDALPNQWIVLDVLHKGWVTP